jgi:alpha-galactosidase
MLEVGNEGLTPAEARSHFSMWAILAAPLMAGNDIRSMSAETKEILLNKEVIAVDQDPLGLQGRRISKQGDLEVWSKQLSDGGRAVALLNRSASEASIEARWVDLGYPDTLKASVRDLWAHKDFPSAQRSFSASVPSHGVVLVHIKP